MATINGDSTDNVLDGTADADTIIGFAGDDTLRGHLGSDTLAGSSDNDHLYGGDGADTLAGETGNDFLDGGAGADTLNGGTGIDTVDYNGSAGVKVSIGGVCHGGDAEGDIVDHDIENIRGTATFDDELSGGAADNVLQGFGGNDKLNGLSGDDTLHGGMGDDLLVGGGGADKLSGSGGIDTVSYSLSNIAVTVVIGGSGMGGDAQGDLIGVDIENIQGSNWADTLTGSAADNLLEGLHGDDTLVGGAGADDLKGGDGTDTADYGGSAAGVAVSLAPFASSGGDAQGDTLTGIENLSGSGQDDQLFGDTGANVLHGRGGDDLLRGVGGADTLIGGDGADTVSYSLSASGVSVSLVTGKGGGGAAGDTLTGIENLNGSTQNDVLNGDAGANVLQGNFGDDMLRGGAGADTFNGGIGIDTVSYFESSLSVAVSLATGKGSGGDAQGDKLAGIEKLSGSQANDGLEGDGWHNTLLGWNGNDALVGGGGKDTLSGGAGADRFYFKAVTDSVVGADADRITDFSHAQFDRVDLTLIDANPGAAADQAFSFIGTALYTGVAGQLRYVVGGGVTTVAGDVNGDKVSDFHIQLTGTFSLVAVDFVL